MKRRIVSLLMVVLLLLPAAVSMAATVPVTITSDDVRGNVGDTVTATLNITIDPPKLGQSMDSLQFLLVYDSAALEYVGIQEVSQDRINILGAQYICSVTTNTGKVGFTAAATDGSSGSGVLMHVRFKILSPVSTMLVLKNVAYSFAGKNGSSPSARQGGTMNLGRITGQSVPTTAAPASTAPASTPEASSIPTDEPRFPVTEVTLSPNASPTAAPESGDSDILAYIVFGLFIVVAILICVVLTLMIVRRGKNKARVDYFEDDDEEEGESLASEEDEPLDEAPSRKGSYKEASQDEDEEDEPPIRIVRRSRK